MELQAKKKLPRLHSITETPNLCQHMKRIVNHIDHIKSFFPTYFNSDKEILHSREMEEPVNNDDAGLIIKQGSFNKDTGLWDYPALSSDKPKEMMDQKLHNATQICDKFATSGKIDEKCGLRMYQGNTICMGTLGSVIAVKITIQKLVTKKYRNQLCILELHL